jgi:tetratricopeptide (TPR) repeat protein
MLQAEATTPRLKKYLAEVIARCEQLREVYAEAIGLFERALALDPHSVETQSRLASLLAARVLGQYDRHGRG